MSGAFVVASLVVVFAVIGAFFAELVRIWRKRPSMYSKFWSILITGLVVGAFVAASHFLPHSITW